MEQKVLTFQKVGSDKKFEFFNQIELVNDKFLFRNLIVDRPFDEDSLLKPVLEEGVSLIRVKVKVKNIGSFYFDFDGAKISEKREEMIAKISELKSIENDDLGKVEKMLMIVNEYQPLYGLFADGRDSTLTYEKIQEIFAKQNITIQLLCFLQSVMHPKKAKMPFIVHEPVEVKNEDENKAKKEHKKFKFNIKKIKINWGVIFTWRTDYIFICLFGLLCAFGMLSGTAWALNGDALCAFLFTLGAIFFGITIYAVYADRKDHKEWKYDVQNTLTINLMLLLGLVVGVIASYFTVKGVMKVNEGKVIDYNLALWVGIGVSAFLLIIQNFLPNLIHLIITKIKNKKVKNEGSSK